MKTLIISDLHLGSPLTKSDFKVSQLLSCSKYDKIIFNGDIFDAWETSLENIFTMYPITISVIKELMYKKPIIFITGNHDPKKDKLQSHFPTVRFCEEFTSDNIIIHHGCRFDYFIKKYSKMAKLLFIFCWILERVGLNPQSCCRELLHSVAAKRQNKYYNDLILDIEYDAVEQAKKDGYNILIMGHTHLPKLVSKDNFLYINSGDWKHNYTFVEIEDNIYRLIDKQTGVIIKHEYIETTY